MKAETTRRPLLPACAHEVHPAAPPGRADRLGDRGLQAFVRIGDDQLQPAQAAVRQGAHKVRPDGFGLRGADLHFQHFAPAVGIDADRDDDREGDDAAATPGVQITAVRAFAAMRRGSRKPGNYLPFLNLGTRSSTAPARVSRSRSR